MNLLIFLLILAVLVVVVLALVNALGGIGPRIVAL
jgi:hypothetical protein